MRQLSAVLFIASLHLGTGCSKPLFIQGYKHAVYSVGGEAGADTAMARMLELYKAGVDTQMLVAIGRTDIPLTKAQPESTLGNFSADAVLLAAKALDNKVKASVINYGGLRIAYIAPGIITRGQMYELMPFDNMVAIVEVPGAVLQQFCDHMARYKGWPVSGISYTIREQAATEIFVEGMPLNEHIVYKIAMSDYIAKGGDHCDFLKTLKRRYTSVFVRDAMIDYIVALQQRNGVLHPTLEKRIRYAE